MNLINELKKKQFLEMNGNEKKERLNVNERLEINE